MGSGVAHLLGGWRLWEWLQLPSAVCRVLPAIYPIGWFCFFFNETSGPRGQDGELCVLDRLWGECVSTW